MIVDNLSRLEKPTKDEKGNEITENFPDEHFFSVISPSTLVC